MHWCASAEIVLAFLASYTPLHKEVLETITVTGASTPATGPMNLHELATTRESANMLRVSHLPSLPNEPGRASWELEVPIAFDLLK
jgi:hypothetical protein